MAVVVRIRYILKLEIEIKIRTKIIKIALLLVKIR
jgi:hypothetical protein